MTTLKPLVCPICGLDLSLLKRNLLGSKPSIKQLRAFAETHVRTLHLNDLERDALYSFEAKVAKLTRILQS